MSTNGIQSFSCCRHLIAFAKEPQTHTVIKVARVATAVLCALFAAFADLLLYPPLKLYQSIHEKCTLPPSYNSCIHITPPTETLASAPAIFENLPPANGASYIQESLESAEFASGNLNEGYDRIGPNYDDESACVFAARMTLLHYLEMGGANPPSFINLERFPLLNGAPSAPPLRVLCNQIPECNFIVYREAAVVPGVFNSLSENAKAFYQQVGQHALALAKDPEFIAAFATLRPSIQQ